MPHVEPYLFSNLVEADAKSAKQLNEVLKSETVVAFTNNAQGVLPSMSFEEAGARGRSFAARCRSAQMDASPSKAL